MKKGLIGASILFAIFIGMAGGGLIAIDLGAAQQEEVAHARR